MDSNFSGSIIRQFYRVEVCATGENPSTKEPTANQLAAQAKFKTARTNAKAALADPEQKAILEAAFKAQKKYYSLYGYVFAQEYAKLGD